MLSPRRLLVAAILLAGLVASPAARAATTPATLDYNSAKKLVTITLATNPVLNYIEIGGEPGGAGRYTAYSSAGFTLTPGTSSFCTPSGDIYVCTPHPTRTVVNGSPGPDEVIGLTYAFLPMPSDYNPDLEVHLGDGDDTVQDGDGNDTIDLGNGNDVATNFLGNDTIDGGPGDDTLNGGAANDVISGGDGRDKLLGGKGNDTLDGGAGPDNVNGQDGDDTLTGGPDRDTLLGGDGNDKLDGGDGPDSLDGGNGVDMLQGGDREDVLVGGPGSDVLDGGPGGGDTASYEDRTAGVTVSLDGQANDGEPNENDQVINVEDVSTGSGPDHVIGDGGPNAIYTAGGDDVVDPGGGADVVETGSGADTVTALDGALDRVDCGDDADSFNGDQLDSIANCETTKVSRELQSDVDDDGLPAPVDCDDHDPTRRPGFVDTPGDGIDQNCDGHDAPYTRVGTAVLSQFAAKHGRTRVLFVTLLDVPKAGVVEVRCAGGKKHGCFKGVRRKTFPKGAKTAKLSKQVKGSYRRGAVLDIRVLDGNQIGKVVRYKMQAGSRQPTPSLRCLVPRAKKPTKC